MLTAQELNEVQGLLHYLTTNMTHLRPDDITLIAADGEPAAVVGGDPGGAGYVLKRVYES